MTDRITYTWTDLLNQPGRCEPRHASKEVKLILTSESGVTVRHTCAPADARRISNGLRAAAGHPQGFASVSAPTDAMIATPYESVGITNVGSAVLLTLATLAGGVTHQLKWQKAVLLADQLDFYADLVSRETTDESDNR